MKFEDAGEGTILAHYGEDEKLKGAVVPPIFQNSLFLFETSEQLLAGLSAGTESKSYIYSRVSNPTVDVAEHKLAKLEGTEACKLVGGGLGAIATAIMSAVQQGSHIVIDDSAYGPVRGDLVRYLSKFGVTSTLVDGRNADHVLDAIRPETTAMYLESPSSVMMRLQDIEKITAETRPRKITTVFDNTYNTPLHYRPAEHGIDLVIHSATKYLVGHSDVVAGVVCGSRERILKITQDEISLFGNILAPQQASLLTRGLRTLKVRLKAHESIANRLAQFLDGRPEISRVHHISLDSYPQRELYLRSFKGSGGLFSFEPKVQERSRVLEFCNRLQLFGNGISWGGFESLVVPIKIHATDYAQPTWVIRFYCGLEDPDDLQRDVEGALPALA